MVGYAEYHDAPRQVGLAQAIQRFQPVDAGHVQVEQDQIRIVLLRQRDPLFTVAGLGDDLQASVHADQLFYAVAQHGVVVDQ